MVAEFKYDVALSFAGEQRSQVEAVADRLRSSGIQPFYDRYEKATLWGKDLYQHLSDVYMNQARYCIVFASAEYAQKVWTNHELKSAQARALQEKGAEYILPVRFDDTEIPGILPTACYLEFSSEGPEGICNALLEKLGRSVPASTGPETTPITCDLSPRAFLLSSDPSRSFFQPVKRATWAAEIELEVSAEDTATDAALAQLRGHQKPLVVAHGFDVAIAKLKAAARSSSGGNPSWTIVLVPERSDFANDFEMGTSSVTADEFAERRVRRLLLGEFPAPTLSGGTGGTVDLLNAATNENLLVGLNSIAKIKQADFPILFAQFGSSPIEFLECAWISAVANLKLSAAVQHIDHLKLTLDGNNLHVDFLGRRHRKYANVDPYKIEVLGTIPLKS